MNKVSVPQISKKLKSLKTRTVQLSRWGYNILIRPSYEFYYANGFAKAAVTAFALAVNLILYILLFSIVMSNLFAFDFTSEGLNETILKRHILWPTEGRWYVKACPKKSIYTSHQLITKIAEDEEKKRLEEIKPGLSSEFIVQRFKVTEALAADMALYFRLFLGSPIKGTLPGNPTEYDFELPQRDFVKSPLWFYIAALITAYVSLLLNIRASVESIVSPTPGGPKSPQLRNSLLRRVINLIPGLKTLQINTQIFLMLPVAGLIFVSLLEVLGRGLEEIQFSLLGFLLTSLFSVIISGGVFFLIYISVIRKEISWYNLLLGALYGAFLWLFGRWFFTEYIAVSLYRNLKFFSLAFIMLTWLYYFCCTMFIGLHVAFILQHRNLKEIIAAWIRKDSERIGDHVLLQRAIHIDFLVKMGSSRSASSSLDDNPSGWTNQEEIGNVEGFCRNFVDEAIFNLAAVCPDYIESRLYRGSYQFRLKKDPEEVDAWEILSLKAIPFKALEEFLEYYPSARVLKELLEEIASMQRMSIADLILKVKDNVQKKGGTRQITKSRLTALSSMPRTAFFTRKKIPFAHSQTETKPMLLDKNQGPPTHSFSSAISPSIEGIQSKDFASYEVPTVAFSLNSASPEDLQILKEDLPPKSLNDSAPSRSLPFPFFPENPTEPLLLFSSSQPNLSQTNTSLPIPIQEDATLGNSIPPEKQEKTPKKSSFFDALGVDESTTFYPSGTNQKTASPEFSELENKPTLEMLFPPSSQTPSDFLRSIQPDPKMFLDPETEDPSSSPNKNEESL
ncbi:MAG: YhjD/YihY/BrkB family envelope integrity protein [Planctomycetota bacterium]